MKNKFIYIVLVLPVFFSACLILPEQKNKEEIKQPVKISPLQAKIIKADSLAKKQNWIEAFKLYSDAKKDTDDFKQYQNIQLKKVAVLIGMKNYQAALVALAPMPELPATLNDCKKLALASTILDKMNSKKEYVEALLEVALDNSIDEAGAIEFKAAGYAQLGRLYIKNKKIPRAIKAFKYASELYEMINNQEQAKVCKNIMDYLR